MKTFAHRYADTPHGASNATIPVSVLLTAMFIGAQWVLHVLVMIVTPPRSTEMLYTNPQFTSVSAAVTVLLLAYLGVDLRRNRIEAHGARRYQYGVFGLAALLLVAYLWFLGLSAG